ncbi:MAG: DMT family transporter [Chloroflexota bacterium]|nr:MAG: DMT family transporter [Chloroflexota bacterium]
MDPVLMSVLAGLGGMFGWGISDFLAGLFSKKIGNFRTFFWSQLAGLLFASLLILFFAIQIQMPPFIAVLLPVAAIFYAGAYLLFYKGYEIGNISIVSATINLWAVFTMLFAFIFLGQRLSGMQLLGVIMIIAGVTMVTLNWGSIKNLSIHALKGVRETVAAAVLFGVFWNLSDVIAAEIGWLSTTIFVKIAIILFLLIFSLLFNRQLKMSKITNQTKVMIALVGVLEASAVACFNWGLVVGDVILVTPIASALTIVTITMALVFLKEKISWVQGLGIVVAIIGIILTVF